MKWEEEKKFSMKKKKIEITSCSNPKTVDCRTEYSPKTVATITTRITKTIHTHTRVKIVMHILNVVNLKLSVHFKLRWKQIAANKI